MKNFKIPVKSALFLSKKEPKANLNSSYNMVIGKYDDDEFRGLLEFNLNPRIFDFKIYRADLVIYLNDTKIDLNIESFMLNISRNLENFNPETVDWSTTPKFFQEANFSKIESEFAKNFIRIDISKILKYWIKNRVSIFGLSLIGLSDFSLLYFANTINKKPFLQIYLDDEESSIDNCHLGESHTNRNIHSVKIYDEDLCTHNHTSTNHHNHNNKTAVDYNTYTTNHNNTNNSFDDGLNSSCITKDLNSLTQENTGGNCNHNHFDFANILTNKTLKPNTLEKPVLEETLTAFGSFISINGDLLKPQNSNCSYIKFDSESNILRTNLNIVHDGVFILTSGMYKIDYFANCRSEPFSTLELELDGETLNFSKIQISSSDSPTTASTIINISENNMILKLKISSANSILINTGICAYLNIIKIN